MSSDLRSAADAAALRCSSRRRFLTLSIASCAVSILPVPPILTIPRADAQSWATVASLLMRGTKWLAGVALEHGAQQAIEQWIAITPKALTQPTDYHDRWSFPVRFDGDYQLAQTDYGSYFGVNSHPVLTNRDDYEPHSDLNWAEINGLAVQQQDPTSPLFTVARFGQRPRLLPGYTGERREATNENAAELSDLLDADSTVPKGDYDLAYVRDFCTCNGAMRGYALKLANADANDFKFRLYKA